MAAAAALVALAQVAAGGPAPSPCCNASLCAPTRARRDVAAGAAGAPAPSLKTDDFELFAAPSTWADARSGCQAQGGDLASVHSVEEQQQVGAVCLSASDWGTEGSETAADNNYRACWIGLSDAGQEGTWEWTDGTAVAYSAWWQLPPGESKNMRPPHAIPASQPNGLAGAGEDGAVLWDAVADPAPNWQWVDLCSSSDPQACDARGVHRHPAVCRIRGRSWVQWLLAVLILLATLAATGFYIVPAIMKRVGVKEPLIGAPPTGSEAEGGGARP